MKCKKVRYKDHMQAFNAIQKINVYSDRNEVPVRAYECDLCNGWHITKAEILTDKAVVNRLKFYDQWIALIKSCRQ